MRARDLSTGSRFKLARRFDSFGFRFCRLTTYYAAPRRKLNQILVKRCSVDWAKGNEVMDGKANCDTAANANVESHPCDATFREDEASRISTPCRITFVHSRKRLADPDGLSIKALLDGIVQVGILADDSTKQVEEIRHRQVKSSVEETEVIIEY